jgi:hypothetical protein
MSRNAKRPDARLVMRVARTTCDVFTQLTRPIHRGKTYAYITPRMQARMRTLASSPSRKEAAEEVGAGDTVVPRSGGCDESGAAGCA